MRSVEHPSNTHETKSDATHRNNSLWEQTFCNSGIERSEILANFRAFNPLDAAVDYTMISRQSVSSWNFWDSNNCRQTLCRIVIRVLIIAIPSFGDLNNVTASVKYSAIEIEMELEILEKKMNFSSTPWRDAHGAGSGTVSPLLGSRFEGWKCFPGFFRYNSKIQSASVPYIYLSCRCFHDYW